MKLTCIAVDDEPLALNIIEDYVSRIDYLLLTASCGSAVDALRVLHEQAVDIVFLDIQMPELSGFEFLTALDRRPMVIFTTAYENYAVGSYEYGAADYLLKPFSFARFLQAVEKCVGRFVDSTSGNGDSEYLFIHSSGRTDRVLVTDIQFIEALSDYIVIKTPQRKFVVRESLRRAEEFLRRRGFVRVHKSYVVPIDRIVRIENDVIRIGDAVIPIGRNFRGAFYESIKNRTIG
jgi:two-component system, LytTR family, response regulator